MFIPEDAGAHDVFMASCLLEFAHFLFQVKLVVAESFEVFADELILPL